MIPTHCPLAPQVRGYGPRKVESRGAPSSGQDCIRRSGAGLARAVAHHHSRKWRPPPTLAGLVSAALFVVVVFVVVFVVFFVLVVFVVFFVMVLLVVFFAVTVKEANSEDVRDYHLSPLLLVAACSANRVTDQHDQAASVPRSRECVT
jgi:predicted membrane metal-binding protein